MSKLQKLQQIFDKWAYECGYYTLLSTNQKHLMVKNQDNVMTYAFISELFELEINFWINFEQNAIMIEREQLKE